MPDVSVIGLPVPGIGGIEYLTSEHDWVVTGIHRGEHFRRYVSSNATRDDAIRIAAIALRLTPDGLEWITARRRNEVENCIQHGCDWIRSRIV